MKASEWEGYKDYVNAVRPIRQVPLRHGEAARSWLGGLPMMAEDIPWPSKFNADDPRYASGLLHHHAQICCADFPDELWSGKGPRSGWLIFFCSASDRFDADRAGKVIHVEELGPERVPPPELRNITQPSYLERSSLFPKPQRSYSRRWPVDIVSELAANSAQEGKAASVIDCHPWRDSDAKKLEYHPFDWSMAITFVDTLRDNITKRYSIKTPPYLLDPCAKLGWGGTKARIQKIIQTRRRHQHGKAVIKRLTYDKIARDTGLGIDHPDIPSAYQNAVSQLQSAFPNMSWYRSVAILLGVQSRLERRKQQKEQEAHLARKKLHSRMAELSQKVRELAREDNAFKDSWPCFYETILSVTLEVRIWEGNECPPKEVSVVEVDGLADYAASVFDYVSDAYTNNTSVLADVPQPLLKYLLKKWTVGSNHWRRRIGAKPVWHQNDPYCLFTPDQRSSWITRFHKDRQGGEFRSPTHSRFDGENALLLQTTNDYALSTEYIEQYFIIPMDALEDGDWSQAILVIDGD
jgi:hypothetical protein